MQNMCIFIVFLLYYYLTRKYFLPVFIVFEVHFVFGCFSLGSWNFRRFLITFLIPLKKNKYQFNMKLLKKEKKTHLNNSHQFSSPTHSWVQYQACATACLMGTSDARATTFPDFPVRNLTIIILTQWTLQSKWMEKEDTWTSLVEMD